MLFRWNTKKERRYPVGGFLRSEAGKFCCCLFAYFYQQLNILPSFSCRVTTESGACQHIICSKGREEPKQRTQSRRLSPVPSGFVLPPKPPPVWATSSFLVTLEKVEQDGAAKASLSFFLFWRPPFFLFFSFSLVCLWWWWWCSGWMPSLLCCVCVSCCRTSLFVVTKFN